MPQSLQTHSAALVTSCHPVNILRSAASVACRGSRRRAGDRIRSSASSRSLTTRSSSTTTTANSNSDRIKRHGIQLSAAASAGNDAYDEPFSTGGLHLNVRHVDPDSYNASEPTASISYATSTYTRQPLQQQRQKGRPSPAANNNADAFVDRSGAKLSPSPSTVSTVACATPGPGLQPRQPGSTTPPIFPRSLDSVRGSLIRQEETIIFSLIEREQFRQNSIIYTDRTFRLHKDGLVDVYGRDASFLEYMLCETEKLHAREIPLTFGAYLSVADEVTTWMFDVRRYMSLEELAFFPSFLPEPILPPLNFPPLLAPNDVNLNREILARYVSEVVPMICEPGDDEQHGSSVVCDVMALQAISRRVHCGKFVAESKYQEDWRIYQDLCRAGDAAGVNALLTNKEVENRVLQRAYMKASTYGMDMNDVPVEPSRDAGAEGNGEGGGLSSSSNFKVDPQVIVDIYREIIIPLTKDVEILYLFERTGYPCPSLEGIHD